MKQTSQSFASIVCILVGLGSFNGIAQVGINTTNPADGSILDVDSPEKGILLPRVNIADLSTIDPISGGSTEGLLVYNSNTTTGPGFVFWNGSEWISIDGDNDWKKDGNTGTTPGTAANENFIGTSDAQDLIVATDGAERIRVDMNGVVGIGTTSPATGYEGNAVSRLTIVGQATSGGGSFTHMTEIENTGSGAAIGILNSDANNDSPALNAGSFNADAIGVRGLNLNGDDTGPAIGVFGSTNSSNSGWAGYFNGDVVATNYFVLSDRRIKRNIEPLSDKALETVLSLEPKRYSWRTDEYPGLSYAKDDISFGFIAQDLRVLAPELVKTKAVPDMTKEYTMQEGSTESLDVYLVNYQGLIPLLTQAIKEQQKIIARQSEKISSLEQRIDKIESRMK